MTSPFRLCLFFKQKINNVLMSYRIATHVKLVHRKDIFWIIVRNAIICTEFTFDLPHLLSIIIDINTKIINLIEYSRCFLIT